MHTIRQQVFTPLRTAARLKSHPVNALCQPRDCFIIISGNNRLNHTLNSILQSQCVFASVSPATVHSTFLEPLCQTHCQRKCMGSNNTCTHVALLSHNTRNKITKQTKKPHSFRNQHPIDAHAIKAS
jgi:hypothetical protein